MRGTKLITGIPLPMDGQFQCPICKAVQTCTVDEVPFESPICEADGAAMLLAGWSKATRIGGSGDNDFDEIVDERDHLTDRIKWLESERERLLSVLGDMAFNSPQGRSPGWFQRQAKRAVGA